MFVTLIDSRFLSFRDAYSIKSASVLSTSSDNFLTGLERT